MSSASLALHEPFERLQPETIDRHRAVISLIEELQAVDWYHQRIDAAEDEELRRILVHNRDEEKEHAAMLLEWIRRKDPFLDETLRKYLFTEGTIEEKGEEKQSGPAHGGSLSIGSLRGGER